MIEYCVTFVKEAEGAEPVAVYHAHIHADPNAPLLQVLQHLGAGMAQQNVSIEGATDIAVRAMVTLDDPLHKSYEELRHAMHPGSQGVVQQDPPSGPLH